MTRAVLLALWSHWRRAPLQLIALVGGLALATALWSGVQAINSEARASYAEAAQQLGTDRYDTLTAPSGRIEQAAWVALRRAGWQVSPVIEGRKDGLRVIGVEPLTAPRGLPMTGESEASFDTMVVHPSDERRAAVWGAPLLMTGPRPGTVVGDIGAVQSLLDRNDLSRLIVLPEQPLGLPPLDQIAPGLLRTPAGQSEVAALTDSFHLNLTAFAALSFVVGIFIVHASIGLAFEQRRPLVRTLRALGAPLGTIAALMGAELALLGLLSGALGLILGYAIAGALLPDVAATLRGLYGAEVSGGLSYRPVWTIAGLGMALAGTALAGASGLIALMRMPLLAAGQSRAWALRSSRTARGQAIAGAVLLFVAAGLGIWGTGLIAGFALLAALLVGGALLLPPILSALLTLAAKLARAPLPQWVWADTRQQLPGLSLSLMALLLAMATNIGVATMVSSFRTTFQGFLDQRLAAELYVSLPDTTVPLEQIADQSGADLLPIRSVRVTLAGQPTDLYGTRDHATYRESWRFLDSTPTAWEDVFARRAIVVNEQLARRSDLWVGDRVTLPDGTTLPIAGVYGDYGNPIGHAMIAAPMWEALFPGVPSQRFGVRTRDPQALRSQLIDAGLAPADVIDQAALKSESLAIFDRTFVVTTALNVLTLAVAGFAILMSLLTLAQMRLPQLAPVWALGLTRARLGQIELLRALMLALFTALIAVPLGLALAWALLSVVNVEAFGWRLPMQLFPTLYLRLVALAVLASGLAALWPAWRMARTSPARLLSVFAHAR